MAPRLGPRRRAARWPLPPSQAPGPGPARAPQPVPPHTAILYARWRCQARAGPLPEGPAQAGAAAGWRPLRRALTLSLTEPGRVNFCHVAYRGGEKGPQGSGVPR
eukprot:4013204-Prymnesium_polylepis.1